MSTPQKFKEDEIEAFEAENKLGFLATINPEGLPHITLITSLQANGPDKLVFAQFVDGQTTEHIQQNPHTGFLILTNDKMLWRGTSYWTQQKKEGEEFEMFNKKPMFRYNSYFGISAVHYLDLISVKEKQALPLSRIIPSILLTKLTKGLVKNRALGKERILNLWSQNLFNKLNALKFIAYVDEDGYPVIIPLLQCQAADSRRMAFSTLAYGDELKLIPKGSTVAIYGFTMEIETVVLRGVFQGFQKTGLNQLGVVDINWVYNCMPPKHEQIYPPVALERVEDF